jgi:hypothetical protein
MALSVRLFSVICLLSLVFSNASLAQSPVNTIGPVGLNQTKLASETSNPETVIPERPKPYQLGFTQKLVLPLAFTGLAAMIIVAAVGLKDTSNPIDPRSVRTGIVLSAGVGLTGMGFGLFNAIQVNKRAAEINKWEEKYGKRQALIIAPVLRTDGMGASLAYSF